MTLKSDCDRAVKRILSSFITTKKLHASLEKLESSSKYDDLERAAQRGFQLLRYIVRIERRINREEKRVESDLEELKDVLTGDLKVEDQDLLDELTLAERKLLEVLDVLREKMDKHKLNNYLEDEKALERDQNELSSGGADSQVSASSINARMAVDGFVKDSEEALDELVEWENSTLVTLRKIENFEEVLAKANVAA
tara:strand:+ start:943 stop:1533 length:591 start_codon:yes stop_codon:yes gene_type:complete